ncbi:hypothetical protein D9Q98_003656 [Chlorella vulgaris]|uniref:MYND-type domain-containing protein n=1 Tax=Chlorella vulgaris TaxID=3077 RepID=A0A9D4TTL0_CHLVU|nr:hypothetical protein D9Q98_003656 [Chlorella vulgaris]
MSVAQAEAAIVAASLPARNDDGMDEGGDASEEDCDSHEDDDDVSLVAALLTSSIKLGPAALACSQPVQQALEQLAEQCEATEASRSADDHAELLADLQLHQQQRREPQAGDALDLAQAAATRSCAYLRCANLAGEGGPAARQGAGSKRCSKCRVAWYCGTACSHADWRVGHRRVCRALGATSLAEQQGQGQQNGEALLLAGQ